MPQTPPPLTRGSAMAPAAWIGLVVFLVVAALPRTVAAEASPVPHPNVLFHAPLDGELKATTAQGRAKPLASPKSPRFVEGKDGEGLLTGNPQSAVKYATKNNFHIDRGALAMWVKPMDWGNDRNMRFFFRVEGAPHSASAGEFLWLYQFFGGPGRALSKQMTPIPTLDMVRPGGQTFGGRMRHHWQAGRWAQLLMSWSGDQLSFYINGKYVGTTDVPRDPLLEKVKDVFVLGGQNRREGGTADTVVDDLLILDRPVTPALASAIYKQGAKAVRTANARQVQPIMSMLKTGYLLSEGQVKVKPTLLGLTPDDLHQLRFQCTITAEGENHQPAVKATQSLKHLGDSLHFDGRSLAPGQYQVTLKVKQNAKVLASGRSTFEKFEPPQWVGNQIGVLSKTPPWARPVKTQAHSADVWGRSYQWADKGLLKQATSQGQCMLARPVTLTGRINGRNRSLDQVRFTWQPREGTKRPFTLEGSLGPLNVRANGWVDYDGFVWYQITVEPPANGKQLSIEALTISIAQKPEAAKLMFGRPPVSNYGDGGKVHAVEGQVRSGPVYWLGNPHVGLQWSIADTHDWKLADPKKMIALEPGHDNEPTTWKLRLITRRVSPDRALHYTLGLHATPVKALPKDWRRWEQNTIPKSAEPGHAKAKWRRLHWGNWNRRPGDKHGPYGYMVASEKTLGLLKKQQEPWIYWHQSGIWRGDPVLKQFGAQWGGTYLKGAGPYRAISPISTPLLNDFKIWRLHHLLRDNPELRQGVGGLYVDTTHPNWTTRHRYPDGQIGNHYTLPERRSLQKRAYQMINKQWPDFLVMNHESGKPQLSQLAFADIYFTGEHFATRLSGRSNYFDLLTYDKLRGAYNPHVLGLPVLYLPNLVRANKGNDKLIKKIEGPQGIPAAEHLQGMLWAHDVLAYSVYINKKPFVRAINAKAAFGYEGIEFHGYWENKNLVHQKSDNPKVVTSLYTRPNRAMFIVMNDSDQPASVTLDPNWNALNMQPDKVIDIYAAQSSESKSPNLPVDHGRIRFQVQPRNFRALATP